MPVYEVGELAGGVAAAEWSPDSELLSLVSGRGQLLLMNKVRLDAVYASMHLTQAKPTSLEQNMRQAAALLLSRTGM